MRGAPPPAPQEEQLRASLLYVFAELDVGLPKSVESKKKMIEPLIKAPPAQPARVESTCGSHCNSGSASSKYCGSIWMEAWDACGIA